MKFTIALLAGLLMIGSDPRVQVCWDADRLDLWRVWITPDKKRLATQAALSMCIFD